jgi:hypothetical protein
MFQLLGTNPEQKRYIASGIGHVTAPSAERIQETIAWFDKFLGPTSHSTTAAAVAH